MPVDQPFTTYQDQLTGLSHGLPLWNPNPVKQFYNRVSIGDVGYLDEGTFIRMFNVILPWDHPSNGLLGNPEPYDPLDCGPFANTIDVPFDKVDHHSRFVTADTNAVNFHATGPDDAEGVTYKFRNRGALLSLPDGGHHEDAIRTTVFEDYIRDHVDGWFNWAQNNRLSVERIENIILVTGCTLVTSWAAAACGDNNFEAEFSLGTRLVSNVGASFVWSNVRGHVSYHNSRFDPQNPSTMADQCVFIRGLRAKRVLFTIRVIGIDDSQIGGSSSSFKRSSFTVYQDQLSGLFQGLALWNPNPQKKIYNRVSIGDVGYMHEGTFIRMFNVMLPWDDPFNGLVGNPEPYDRLDLGAFVNIREAKFNKVDHCSRFVTAETDPGFHARPDDVTYKFRNRGALLSLPNGGRRLDIIRTKVFEDYIRDHADKWFNWAQNNRLGVERMEDLILVSGCTLVTSWAAAVCVDNTFGAEISLGSRLVSNVGASVVWSNVLGPVSHHNSRFDPQNPPTMADADHCVFIRGFRVKRVLFGKRVIGAVSGAADEISPNRDRRPRKRNNRLHNAASSLGDDSIGGSSSSLNTINPQRSPYQRDSLDDSLSSLSHIWGSSSSLDTIRPINHDNPQHHPYPSSTTLQSNGSVYNASLMTSPSYEDSIIEVLDDIAETRDEDTFAEDTTSITTDNDPSAR